MTASATGTATSIITTRPQLWAQGYYRLGKLLIGEECEQLRSLYQQSNLFRARVEMSRHGYGQGEYQYFQYPLPQLVERLRYDLYKDLLDDANNWMKALSTGIMFPSNLRAFIHYCRVQRQKRPTPLLLRYRSGDFNRLHQDRYGPVAFPFQVIVCLSRPDSEFTGGELLLLDEQLKGQPIGQRGWQKPSAIWQKYPREVRWVHSGGAAPRLHQTEDGERNAGDDGPH